MRYTIRLSVLVAAAIFTVSASAQVPLTRAEKAGSRTELKVSKNQLERDAAELAAFKDMTTSFKAAIIAGNGNKARAIQASILEAMDREIRQSERKTFSDKREVRRSSKEVRSSNRELRQSQQDRAVANDSRIDNVRNVRDERRDRQDDIRDLNDDKIDLANQANRTKAQKEIRTRFASWVYQDRAPASVEATAEIKLLNMFVASMEHDLKSTRTEIGEDRAELREDRRELREDKRERRERY